MAKILDFNSVRNFSQESKESRVEGEWFTNFSSVLPTSQVGYHAGKPIESVVYCCYKITLVERSFLGKKCGFSTVIKPCLLSKVTISQSWFTI